MKVKLFILFQIFPISEKRKLGMWLKERKRIE
jgi:hypothetical protein